MKHPIKGAAAIGLIIALSGLCGTASAAPSPVAELYQLTCTISNGYTAIGIPDIYSLPAVLIAAAAGAAVAAVICLIAAAVSRKDRRGMEMNEAPKISEEPKK